MRKRAHFVLIAGCCLAAALILAWMRSHHGQTIAAEEIRNIGQPLTIATPLGLPPVPVPRDNPMTTQKVALGRALFYDRRLSLDNSLNCASCHNPLLGFTDGNVHSTGVGGRPGKRNSMALLNAAYDPFQFWDGRSASLEDQVGTPMANPDEMNQPHTIAVAKLNKDPELRVKFEEAFGPGPVTIGKIEKALASFERLLISGNSAFDRYQFGGDKDALSAAAAHGLAIFQDPGRGNCIACHTISDHYALFTDGKFHNTGEGVDEEGNLNDLGRFVETGVETDKGSFKTPSLRNVAQSAPYMHDGKLKTLKDVVDFYAGGGNSNPYLDKNMKVISLSARDRSDLVEFLKSLSGEMPTDSGPLQATAK